MNPKNEERTPNGADKVDRYNWCHPGKMGSFALLHKRQLNIPTHSYQREAVSEAKVLRIAAEFSWIAFGALIVSKRDGKYWVVEGGHRLRACMRRSDITVLPCIVFEISEERGEAKSYREINTNRRPMDGADRHKAFVTEGDDLAELIERCAGEAGRRIAKSAGPTTIRCVQDMRRCLESDRDSFFSVWPVVHELCKGHPLHQRVLRALFYIERNIESSLSDQRWKQRVLAVGYEQILESIAKAAAFYAAGGDSVWAEGALQAINRGLRKRLKLKKDKP